MTAGGWQAGAAAAAALALAGCQTMKTSRVELPPPAPEVTLPAPVVVEVTPPAGAARAECVPRGLRPPPRYPDSDAALRAAAGAADRYQLMAAGRLMRQRRLEELERIVARCK
jgi:hypothetical protein